MTDYLKLNNEVLNQYSKTGFIDLEKDREATNSYLNNYVQPKMRFFQSIEEKIHYLLKEKYYEEEFLEKYSLSFIKSIFDIAYSYKFQF